MGVIHYVGCRDCEVKRDLDKFYAMQPNIETREDALELGEYLKVSHSFRAGLLASFMKKHAGHNCTVWDDCNDWDNPENDYREDYDFWDSWKYREDDDE